MSAKYQKAYDYLDANKIVYTKARPASWFTYTSWVYEIGIALGDKIHIIRASPSADKTYYIIKHLVDTHLNSKDNAQVT